MIIDALVLAGGRSSRLNGVPKANLVVGGAALLQTTLAAAAFARRVVVVGDAETVATAAPGADVTVVRESPAFGGPAAAIISGVAALDSLTGEPSDFTLVLACDMPRIGEAVHVLLGELRAGTDGAVSVSADGRVQSLAAVYSTPGLAVAAREHAGDARNLSVRALVAHLHPDPVEVPLGSTDDIDTWPDAEAFGVHRQPTEERA